MLKLPGRVVLPLYGVEGEVPLLGGEGLPVAQLLLGSVDLDEAEGLEWILLRGTLSCSGQPGLPQVLGAGVYKVSYPPSLGEKEVFRVCWERISSCEEEREYHGCGEKYNVKEGKQ